MINTDNPYNNPRLATQQANSFDWALPQEWVDDFNKVTGVYPAARGLFVWSYAKARIWGEPFPLTEEADKLLEIYNNASSSLRP